MRKALIAPAAIAALVSIGRAQQPDVDFKPEIGTPTYAVGTGPRVAIDGGHNNLHTVDGGYRPFAELLRRDGYRVSGLNEPFADESLRQIDILVTVNATGPRDARAASAFTEAEVAAVDRWVRGGGALLLVSDHEPWAAAAGLLAGRLGVEFKNAYAYDGPAGNRQAVIVYRKGDGALADHPVTAGVNAVATFLGSAFRIGGAHVPLLRFSPTAVARPTLGTAPQRDEQPIGGWLQGALLEHGRGRVGVFGEAAMFSAQVRAQGRMGMNAPGAEDNPRFLLNVARWLTPQP